MTRAKTFLLAAGLCLLMLIVSAGSQPDVGLNRGLTVGMSNAMGARGGSAKVDTTRVISWTTTYPNSAAKAAGYITGADTSGVSNKADDGTTVKWGWINEADSTNVQCSPSANSDYVMWTRPRWLSTLDDLATGPITDQRFAFLWFSANGLKHGQKVENAYIMFNELNGASGIGASQVISARLDTIAKDYRIVASTSVGTSSNNDAGRFGATWVHINKALTQTWDPPLGARDDAHDFGPASNTRITAQDPATGYCYRLEVTDAIQQALDDTQFDLTKGFLFILVGSQSSSTNSVQFGAGNQASVIGAGATGCKGNPVFTATTTSRRGNKAWNGEARVPIVFLWDDTYDIHSAYYSAFRDSGMTFTAAVSGYGFSSQSDYPDTLLALGRTDVKIVNHSKFHETIGSVSADSMNQDLSRKWMIQYFPNAIAASNFDTTAIVDYAWPGNDRRPNRGLNAISGMIDHGYRSARSGGYYWTAGETATWHDTRLSWDGYVNKYLLWSENAKNLFAVGGAPATQAQVADQLGDLVDDAYTSFGKSALVIYGHSYNELSVAEFTTGAMLRYVIGLTNQWRSCQIMDYGHIVGMRIAGSTELAPSQVKVMRGITSDSTMIKTMATDQDSAYAVDSDPNYLKMWLSPK